MYWETIIKEKMRRLKILILVGMPASGKSTWAREFVSINENWIRINRDDFRMMLKNSAICDSKVESIISDLEFSSIENALYRKMNVIVDNTNLRSKYIQSFVKKFKYRADIDFKLFDISIEEAIERNSGRDNPVNNGDMIKMNERYKNIVNSFDFAPIRINERRPNIQPKFESELQNAVIFDIDQTISLISDRSPFDWGRVGEDTPNLIVSEHIDFHKSKGRKIILVSGRDESSREETNKWLDSHGIYFDSLFMRSKSDFRGDNIVKREIYDTKIENKYNILCVYDDRLRVLEMWNQLGLFTFNVNQYNELY